MVKGLRWCRVSDDGASDVSLMESTRDGDRWMQRSRLDERIDRVLRILFFVSIIPELRLVTAAPPDSILYSVFYTLD